MSHFRSKLVKKKNKHQSLNYSTKVQLTQIQFDRKKRKKRKYQFGLCIGLEGTISEQRLWCSLEIYSQVIQPPLIPWLMCLMTPMTRESWSVTLRTIYKVTTLLEVKYLSLLQQLELKQPFGWQEKHLQEPKTNSSCLLLKHFRLNIQTVC